MDYIKIVLVIYLILRFINIFPSHNLSLDNDLQNATIILLLFVLAIVDPVVCFISITIVLMHIKTQQVEKLFTSSDRNDLKKIANTILYAPKNKQDITIQESMSPKKTRSTIITEEMDHCGKEFIISKSMLANAQTNIVNTKYMQQYPNVLNDSNVNIQGFHEDIIGFNLY